jgi:glutamine amidotransferase
VSASASVVVADLGSGNLRSVEKALAAVGARVAISADADTVARAEKLVVPGQGAFGACAAGLDRGGGAMRQAVHDVIRAGRPFFGICIGMQLLFERSEEDDAATGLGVIPGVVRWIPPGVKRPQMQWNTLQLQRPDDPLFAGLGAEPWMYFVHSLHGVPDDPASVAATCEYGTELTAAIRQGNVFATQFHPEKSGTAGLELLANFTRVAAGLVRS